MSIVLNANARHIPLADASVQCVVTSPPYWGLRSYSTHPQVWGGRADCVHEWGATPPRRPRSAKDSANSPKQQTNAGTLFDAQGGDYCAVCGAWRGELGSEPRLSLFVEHMRDVFAEVWRVLRDDGVLWLNLGDSYATGKGASGQKGAEFQQLRVESGESFSSPAAHVGGKGKTTPKDNAAMLRDEGLKPKDLCGVPWRVAFALQDAGWWLRTAVVWHKLNAMPESVRDRPTRAHEFIFLLTKNGGKALIWQARDTGEWSRSPDFAQTVGEGDDVIARWQGFDYFYDADAIKEPIKVASLARLGRGVSGDHKNTDGAPGQTPHTISQPRANVRFGGNKRNGGATYSGKEWKPSMGGGGNGFKGHSGNFDAEGNVIGGGLANARDVWPISTSQYNAAHFATFPEELPRRCILAGSRPGDLVLDPFSGSGTTGKMAIELGRRYVGLELNPDYIALSCERMTTTIGMAI